MPFDVFSGPDATTLRGPLTQVPDPTTTVNAVQLLALGLAMSSAAGQAIVTGNTVTLIANQSVIRLTLAGAATGVILPPGPGYAQLLILIISTAAANTLTFATAATSNVAGGAAVSLAGLAAHAFIWDPVGLLWYQVGPLAN